MADNDVQSFLPTCPRVREILDQIHTALFDDDLCPDGGGEDILPPVQRKSWG
jgi:hypothetical protein